MPISHPATSKKAGVNGGKKVMIFYIGHKEPHLSEAIFLTACVVDKCNLSKMVIEIQIIHNY